MTTEFLQTIQNDVQNAVAEYFTGLGLDQPFTIKVDHGAKDGPFMALIINEGLIVDSCLDFGSEGKGQVYIALQNDVVKVAVPVDFHIGKAVSYKKIPLPPDYLETHGRIWSWGMLFTEGRHGGMCVHYNKVTKWMHWPENWYESETPDELVALVFTKAIDVLFALMM